MAGFKTIVGMVNGMLEELKITVPVRFIWIMEPMRAA